MVSTGGTPVLFFLIQDGDTLSACLDAAPFSSASPGYPEHRLPAGADPCIPSDIQQVAIYLQCTVCLMCKNTFCKDFTKLNTFLVEAVYIP